MKSAGSVYDEIVYKDGALKAIKRIGSVDLGTSDWTQHNSDNSLFVLLLEDRPYKEEVGFDISTNKYSNQGSVSQYNDVNDKCFSYYYQRGRTGDNLNVIYIKDSSYTTVNDFKQSMSGVTLYYELNTPIEYEIAPREVVKVYIGSDLVYANDDYYGVDINTSTGSVTRIGRMEWHRTLPIQSKMRRVSILTDGTVRELNDSNVNDLDADIMVEIPEHYSETYSETIDGVRHDIIKLYPYAHKGKLVPKHYLGAFKAAVNRSNNQLRSVITVDVNNCDINIDLRQ